MLFFLDLLEALLLHPLESWRELTTHGRCTSAQFAAEQLRRSWKTRRHK